MAKTLHDWLSSDVAAVRDKPLRWLSEHYFFRDPSRLNYSDPAYFFAPADGVILYVHQVGAGGGDRADQGSGLFASHRPAR
jgi:phosphatidylserine decarboxylase